MKSFLSSSLHITDNKRKRILATPNKYDDHGCSSLQIISRRTFEAALYKVHPPIKTFIAPSWVVAAPSTYYDQDQGGSSLEVISREVFEASINKLPKRSKTTKTSVGSSWFRSICLGEGAHGVVYLAHINDDVNVDALPVTMAIKSAPITYSSSLSDEERILKGLSSPFVISCYGSKITTAETRPGGSDYNLILEYCSGGSIADYLKFRGKGMAESDVQLFALDIIKGISYIHSKKIIHCDIKPANILLKPQVDRFMPNGFEPKLADFGLALRKTSDEYGDGCGFTRGTLLYMSPEHLYNGDLDYCADIWSYGCTILEMITGKRPWSELGLIDRNKLKDAIGNSNVKPEIPTWLSDDARDFLEKCLEKDPKKRYDSIALLQHKFLTSIHGHCGKEEEA